MAWAKTGKQSITEVDIEVAFAIVVNALEY